MLLCFDIGNTFLKYAVYENDQLISFSKSKFHKLNLLNLKKYKIKNIAISSVVPSNLITLKNELDNVFGIVPFVINRNLKLNILLDFLDTSTIGIDRICAASGAVAFFSENSTSPILAIDLGTATTINLIKPNNIFSGGIIAPGMKTMINSLNLQTAQLPEINLENYELFFGKDTKSAIASGVVNSTLGLINFAVQNVQTEFNSEPKLIITGGNSDFIKGKIDYEFVQIKDLVLRGVKKIFEINNIIFHN